MAITVTLTNGDYKEMAGSSGDTKPTDVATGSLFMEADTGDIYVFDADSEAWTKIGG